MSDIKHPPTEDPVATGDAPAVEEGADDASKKQKKQRLIALAAVVILVLSAIGGTVIWWKKTRAAAHKDKKPAASAHANANAEEEDDDTPPVFMPLEKIVVKLQRTTPTSVEHYLQVGMELKLGDAKVNEKIKLYQPIIQHEVMLILSSKEAEWLDRVENKKSLAIEVRNKINKIIKAESSKEGVRAVYFSSFILQ